MKWAAWQRTKALLIALVCLLLFGIFLQWLSWRRGRGRVLTGSPTPSITIEPIVSTPVPFESPVAVGSPLTSPSPLPSATSPIATPSVQPGDLIIPVSGVRADQLRDTFSEARSEGRVHDAIDIPAPKGTPVLAAARGKIVKLFQSERGGTTIYELSSDEKFIYYYAHLDRYADGLVEGRVVNQGETIAYVGDTGNAGLGNYHLHFSIAITSDPKRYWEGVNINPYPLLKR